MNSPTGLKKIVSMWPDMNEAQKEKRKACCERWYLH